MTNGLMSFMANAARKNVKNLKRGYKLFEKEALEELAREQKINAKKRRLSGSNANRTSSRL